MFVRSIILMLLAATAFASSDLAVPGQVERKLENSIDVDLDKMDPNWTSMDIGQEMGFPAGACMLKNTDGKLEVVVDQEMLEGTNIRKLMEERGLALHPDDEFINVNVISGEFRFVVRLRFNFTQRECELDGFVQRLFPAPGPKIPYRLNVDPENPFKERATQCRTSWVDGKPGSDCLLGARAYYVVGPLFDQCGGSVDPIIHQPFVEGEPHFAQWSGKKFDYQGECDLVFVHAPEFGNGVGMDIHIRTKIRYDYSFIETASVKIGDDVLEVSSYGDYFLNGVMRADMEDATLAGYPITHDQPMEKKSTYEIELGGGNTLSISSMKDIVSVRFNTATDEEGTGLLVQWFANSNGMIGTLESFDMLGRDGFSAISDANEFGQEWQVNGSDPKLFVDVNHAPQFPAKCNLPSADAYQTNRRLGATISREEAAKACDNWPTDQVEDCISDVIAMHDLEFAQAGSY